MRCAAHLVQHGVGRQSGTSGPGRAARKRHNAPTGRTAVRIRGGRIAFGVGLWLLVALPALRVATAEPPAGLEAAGATSSSARPWSQAGGDDHHAGLAPFGRGTLDVVATFNFTRGSQVMMRGGDY